MSNSDGKRWPGNVPAEAEATRMLLGQVSPGEFQSVVDSFRASLGPEERAIFDLRSDELLVSALAVKWRLTAAIAVAPVSASEVDPAAVDALVQESSDAAFGLSGGAASATDPGRKLLFESTRRSLDQLSAKLKASVPRAAPPPAPAAAAPPAHAAAVPPASGAAPTKGAPPAPEARQPAAAASAQSLAAHDEAQGRKKALLLIGAAALVLGVGVHGYRFLEEQAAQQERQAREALLPTEHSAGDVTHITLRASSPEKLAELEARAQREGKRLLRITATEFQLVGSGSGPAQGPTPAPNEGGEGEP